jgi:hypothetical protein
VSLLEGWPDFTPRSTPQADYDLITEFGSVVLNPATEVLCTPSLGTYQGILVTVTTGYTTMISAGVTGGSIAGLVEATQDYIVNGANNTAYMMLPYPCRVGDIIGVELKATPGNAAGVVVNVYGLRFLPLQVRPDMRVPPMGKNTNYQTLGSGGVLIAAPTTPFRLMLKSATISVTTGAAGGGFCALVATVGGSSNGIATIADAVGATATKEWAQGLLCDPATAVTVGATGAATIVCDATWDVVQ